jgi:hypothetical protein
MARSSPKRRRTATPSATPRKQPARPPGDLGAGAEAFQAITDAAGAVLGAGRAAMTIASGTVRLARELAVGVGRVSREMAEDAMRVAGRITTSRDQVATDLGYSAPGDASPEASRLPEDVLSSIGARKPPGKVDAPRSQLTAKRRPPARSPSRTRRAARQTGGKTASQPARTKRSNS